MSRPRETDSLRFGGHDEVGYGLLQRLGRDSWPGGPLGGRRGGGDHLGGKPEGVLHLAVGAANDLGKVVRGDRITGRAADELLDPRLGILHGPQRLHELGGISDPPDGPYGHLDFLAISRGYIDELLGLPGSMPHLKRLGKPEHFLNERQLHVEAWLGLASDRLAELQEHGQLALAHGIEESLAQGNDQHEEHADHE